MEGTPATPAPDAKGESRPTDNMLYYGFVVSTLDGEQQTHACLMAARSVAEAKGLAIETTVAGRPGANTPLVHMVLIPDQYLQHDKRVIATWGKK